MYTRICGESWVRFLGEVRMQWLVHGLSLVISIRQIQDIGLILYLIDIIICNQRWNNTEEKPLLRFILFLCLDLTLPLSKKAKSTHFK